MFSRVFDQYLLPPDDGQRALGSAFNPGEPLSGTLTRDPKLDPLQLAPSGLLVLIQDLSEFL
ncbi:MAG: hypothetical protein AAGA03_11250, partial [Planctomycetota bacterium]